MATAVKTMPTPMPPPEKRVQWLPPNESNSTGNLFAGGKPSVFNGLNSDLPTAQPTKLQRPQSAVVHSMNRRLSAPGSQSEVRSSSESIKINLNQGGENERLDIFQSKMEARPHSSGAGSDGMARNRPQSAMPTMTRGGTVSTGEKVEIEELKREIIEVTKRINSNRQELMLQHAKASSSLGKVTTVEETENALKRFITTNDPAQVQMAKNTLLCMMLQKMEELQRDTLSALNLAHGTTSTDSAPASRNPSTSSSMGSARDRSNSNSNRNNSCYATTLALVDRTKSLASQISAVKDQNTSAAIQLQEAKIQIRDLIEERELLRATLTQAGRPGHSAIKIVRPVSAPRARSKPALSELSETLVLLQAAQAESLSLSGKLAALDEEKTQWGGARRASPPTPSPRKPPPPPIDPAPPASAAAGGEHAKEIAALKKKIAELEKSLGARGKELAEAKEAVERESKAREKLAKECKDKDAKAKELEKALAEALAKISQMEKRLNDVTLNNKANVESNDGAAAREKELNRQIVALTTEVTKVTQANEQLTEGNEKLKLQINELKSKLKDERTESDAIQKKLIGELKDARAKLAESNAELAKALARIQALERELQALQDAQTKGAEAEANKGTADYEAQLADMAQKLSACQAQLSALQSKCIALENEKEEAKKEERLMASRFDSRERDFRLQVERRETEFAAERDELLRRIRELESMMGGADADKAELSLLRSKVKSLQEAVDREFRCSIEKDKNEQAANSQLLKLQDNLKTAELTIKRASDESKALKDSLEDLRKKLLAALRRADAADAMMLKIEGEREETRAVENNFKAKMKALYEKRVRDLESMHAELEQKAAKQAEEHQRAGGVGGGGGGGGGGARPSTAAGSLGAGRRR